MEVLPGYTSVKALIYGDNSGRRIELPILVSYDGPVKPLLQYQLLHQSNSHSWHVKLQQAVRLLLLYAAANPDSYLTPRELFAGFSVRLISGTIGTDGLDPSGLYWIPKRPSHARQMVRMLTEFSAWSAREFGVAELNPLRDATKHEQVLAAAAWAHRNNASFLGHTESKARARLHFGFAPSVPLPRTLAIANPNGVVRFPEEHFPRLIVDGFSRRKCGNSLRRWMALRNILITLLMHGAGLRCSECFHLWVDDVRPDPVDPTRALVWVGHPSDGLAEWRDAAGKIVKGSRREYLLTRGLTPRNLIRGKEHAGWKGTRLDGKYYIQAHWSDASYARIFLSFWKEYLRLILPIERRHPWAFIQRDGGVYKMASFHQDYDNAIKAIGLKPCRVNGTQPHGHRHAYGQRLAEAGVSHSVIQKAMHHASPESQEVYTQADHQRMQSELNAAVDRMSGIRLEDISTVLKLEDAS